MDKEPLRLNYEAVFNYYKNVVGKVPHFLYLRANLKNLTSSVQRKYIYNFDSVPESSDFIKEQKLKSDEAIHIHPVKLVKVQQNKKAHYVIDVIFSDGFFREGYFPVIRPQSYFFHKKNSEKVKIIENIVGSRFQYEKLLDQLTHANEETIELLEDILFNDETFSQSTYDIIIKMGLLRIPSGFFSGFPSGKMLYIASVYPDEDNRGFRRRGKERSPSSGKSPEELSDITIEDFLGTGIPEELLSVEELVEN